MHSFSPLFINLLKNKLYLYLLKDTEVGEDYTGQEPDFSAVVHLHLFHAYMFYALMQ